MILLSDTSLDADQMQLRLLRDKSPSERLGLALRLSSEVIRASKRAISRVHPQWTEREIGYKFIELHYGRELAEATRHYEDERDHDQCE
jgi:hypothetical protein